ncbi:MAG: hypothetical protein ABEK10_02515 [Candidatus Nanosalina sp.]
MDFEDALERAGDVERGDEPEKRQPVSGKDDLESIAEASIDPAAVDPSKAGVEIEETLEQDEKTDVEETATGINEGLEKPDDQDGLEEPEEELSEGFQPGYDKEVVDQISESLSVLTSEGGSDEFFSDMMSEFGETTPEVDEIEEEMVDLGYSRDQVEQEVENLKENHLVSRGELSDRAYAVAEFAAEIHSYLSELNEEVQQMQSEVEENRLVSGIDLDLEDEYFGRASSSFTENSDMKNIGQFISPFDRSGAQRGKETNPLMAFLVAAEKGDRHDIGDLTGYASDESASERVRQIANEGYIDAGEGGNVETTEAGQYLKEAVDSLYERFEDVIEEESRIQQRIERAQEMLDYQEKQKEAATELDKVARQMKSAENMDWNSSRELLKENYSPMAREMSEEYDMDLEADTDVEV